MNNNSGIEEIDVLRKSRDFLQTVIDNIADPTMVTDVNYHIILANKALKKIFDRRDPVAEHLSCFEVIHRLDRPCPVVCPGSYPCPVNEVISTLMPSRVVHTLHDSLDNEIFMEIMVSPIFDETGEIVKIVESFRDITKYIKEEEKLEDLVFDFQNALAKARRLAGLLPICMTCKRIRSEKGDWENIEVYIRNHSEAEFTHGLCPECEKKIYGFRNEREQ
ncbi:MAG: PAS domain-containing protein [Nitrospirae bacterium]|nr:PAS domain-containing protein [Nitrospirota bacterium]